MNSITFFLQYQIIGLRTYSHHIHIPYQSNTIEMYHFDRDNYGVSKNQFHVVRWIVVVVPVYYRIRRKQVTCITRGALPSGRTVLTTSCVRWWRCGCVNVISLKRCKFKLKEVTFWSCLICIYYAYILILMGSHGLIGSVGLDCSFGRPFEYFATEDVFSTQVEMEICMYDCKFLQVVTNHQFLFVSL